MVHRKSCTDNETKADPEIEIRMWGNDKSLSPSLSCHILPVPALLLRITGERCKLPGWTNVFFTFQTISDASFPTAMTSAAIKLQ